MQEKTKRDGFNEQLSAGDIPKIADRLATMFGAQTCIPDSIPSWGRIER